MLFRDLAHGFGQALFEQKFVEVDAVYPDVAQVAVVFVGFGGGDDDGGGGG